jgi:hypothetical protein
VEFEYELVDMSRLMLNTEYAPYLFMLNPSTGVIHAEGIPPGCTTIESSLNWKWKNKWTVDEKVFLVA